jgi:hypothetical protein
LIVTFGAAAMAAAVPFGRQTGAVELWWSACILGLCLDGLLGAAATITPELYPTRARSTGIGWAQSMGASGRDPGSISHQRDPRERRGAGYQYVCIRLGVRNAGHRTVQGRDGKEISQAGFRRGRLMPTRSNDTRQIMKVVIFGAGGRIGSRVAAERSHADIKFYPSYVMLPVSTTYSPRWIS